MSKTPLIYIGGCGHSGSTLLDLILGSHSNLISVGEIDHLKVEKEDEIECTCDSTLNKCEFWKEVLSSFKKQVPEDYFCLRRLPYLSLRNVCQASNLQVAGSGIVLNKQEADCFAEHNNTLFENILDVSEKGKVVDSSKPPTRLYYLYKSNLFEMKVIYLVRNGKAFINSLRNRDRMKDIPNYKSSFHWTIRNYRMRKLIREVLDSDDVIEVHYEDFTSNTQKEIKKVCNFVGIEFEKEMLNFRQKTHHIIGGNPMKNREESKIYTDMKWKEELSLLDHAVFEIIGGYLNRKLGY